MWHIQEAMRRLPELYNPTDIPTVKKTLMNGMMRHVALGFVTGAGNP